MSRRTELPLDLRNKALAIRKKWKDFHKNLLLAERLDVKCDKPTTEKRESSKRVLYSALFGDTNNNTNRDSGQNDAKSMRVDSLEFYIFQYCDSLVSSMYFSTVQKCKTLFAVDETTTETFAKGQMKPAEVVNKALGQSSSSKSVYY